jgi:uncharacterized protein (TIGR03437 family)
MYLSLYSLRFGLALGVLLMTALTASAQTTPFKVVNAASLEESVALAPGEPAIVFGRFTGAVEANAPAAQLPTTLGNANVQIGKTAVRLLYTSNHQINFLVPQNVSTGTAKLSVFVKGRTAGSMPIDVTAARPRLFLAPHDASGPALLLNQNRMLNDASNRARKGELLTAIATGFGQNAGPDSTSALFGEHEVNVESVEAPAHIHGMWLVRVRVPDKREISGQVPFALHMNGKASNTVSVWVK